MMTGKTREEVLAEVVLSMKATELARAAENAGFTTQEILDTVWGIQNEQS